MRTLPSVAIRVRLWTVTAISAVLVFTPGVAARAADPADGAVTPQAACDQTVAYAITSSTDYHMRGIGLSILKDGPGGQINGSVSVSTTVGASMTVGAEADLGAVIAKAKVSVSATLSASVGITIGHSYTHDITKNKYGNMQYGSWGKQVNWKKQQTLANCSTKVLASGTARIPTSSIGWKYWETSS